MKKPILEIEVPESVVQSVLSQDKVDEAPHNFYKYPARFSPVFAHEVIKAFTRYGDTVLDPFCGGGTSVVEAISLGRKGVGFDISSLAVFLARAKTSPLSVHDKFQILNWMAFVESLDQPKIKSIFHDTLESHYHRNLSEVAKAFFEKMVASITLLPKGNQRRFVRLVLLAVGQQVLDCKTNIPTWLDLRTRVCQQIKIFLGHHYQFLSQVAEASRLPRCRITQTRRIINSSSERSGEDGRIPDDWLPAKLVLTSPPYPGVHVLYHRWQINGRRETPAPFWLANSRDGAGESFYCLGARDEPELKTYFKRLQKSFSSIRGLISKKSLVVQLVAFSEPNWQLPAYLQKMEEAGFDELRPICDKGYLFEGRIWRQVPGRRWYANRKGKTTSSKEVLLLHRPAGN